MGTEKPTEELTGPAKGPAGAGPPGLIMVYPEKRALRVPIDEPCGRDWLGAEGTKASRRHIVFTKAGSRLTVEDVGSRNGTWVDGERLLEGQPVDLENGSILRIGAAVLVYRSSFGLPYEPDAPLQVREGPFRELMSPFGMRRARTEIDAIVSQSPTPRSILIEGESGTGKEFIARYLAERLHPGCPYLPVNVAAISKELFEAELFGYVPGAFSGARAGGRKGYVEECNGGTLFLDEIGELPVQAQAKLLRFLDSGAFLRVGETKVQTANVLVMAATNRTLDDEVREKRFKHDVRARFQAYLRLPPLRDRPEDIWDIARTAMPETPAEAQAVERLLLERWGKGNIRELLSTVSRSVASQRASFPGVPPALAHWAVEQTLALAHGAVEQTADPARRASLLTPDRIRQALADAGQNITHAAQRLSTPGHTVTIGTLRRRMKEFGIKRESSG